MILFFRECDVVKKFFKWKIKMLFICVCVMGFFLVVLVFVDIEFMIWGIDINENLLLNDLCVIFDNLFRFVVVVVKLMLLFLLLLIFMIIYWINVNEFYYLVVRNIYYELENFVMILLFLSCLFEVVVCLFYVFFLLDYYGMFYEF